MIYIYIYTYQSSSQVFSKAWRQGGAFKRGVVFVRGVVLMWLRFVENVALVSFCK